MPKVSSRYTWARNSDGCGKPVAPEGAKDAVGLSARTSAFPGQSPKQTKSKNRVWRPASRYAADQLIEKSSRVPGRRLSTATATVSPSVKGKDRSGLHVLSSLGPSTSTTTHRRRRGTGLHGNRVWVPGKVPTVAGDEVEESQKPAPLLVPQRSDNVFQKTLRKPVTNMDAVVTTHPTCNTETSTASSNPGRERVAGTASVGKGRRKKTHGNLVWRPGQTNVPVVSPGKLCGAVLASKGAVQRKVGALRTTKYRWQRKLSTESPSPSGKTLVPSATHSVSHSPWLQNRRLSHSRSRYQWRAVGSHPNPNSRLTPRQRLLHRSLITSKYKWYSGGAGSAASLSPSPSSSIGRVQRLQGMPHRIPHRSSLNWFSNAWLASNRRASTDASRERKRTVSWGRSGRGRVPAKKKKMAANRIWIPSQLRVYRRRSSTSKRPSLEEAGRSVPLTETPVIPSSQSATRVLASHAVRRSKAYFWSAKLSQKQKQLCMYYCRFGKCSRDNCPYIHDPEKISVCQKFVRGVCDKMDGSCLLSHKVDKSKMPVCSFYLRGVCGREECPYLHVNVGRDAEVCKDFLKGHCPHGTECPKLHAYHCPEFNSSGVCPRGSQCPLKHQQLIQDGRGRERETGESASNVKTPKAFKNSTHFDWQPPTEDHDGIISGAGNKQNEEGDEGEVEQESVLSVRPLDLNEMPDFIPLYTGAMWGDVVERVRAGVGRRRHNDIEFTITGSVSWDTDQILPMMWSQMVASWSG